MLKEPRADFVHCIECGIKFSYLIYEKRISRGAADPLKCGDCLDFGKPIGKSWTWIHPKLGKIVCVPWRGEVDDDFHPIRNGKRYKVGVRICGIKDCVATRHLIQSPSRKRAVKPKVAVKLVADPVETVLALHEFSQYKKTPTKNMVSSGGTE